MEQTQSPRILIIDDDPDMVELFEIVLELNGYRVTSAGNGAEAITMLQRALPAGEIDIVMVDLMMPVMDGLQFLRLLRKGLKCSLPVLALSAMNKQEEIDRAREAGADAVLNKPIEPSLVIRKLSMMLEK